MKKKQYSVNVLLNKDYSKVLLQTKDRTTFAGRLNGVGGKVEDDEDPVAGALREIEEETSIRPEDLSRFEWIGTLSLPEQCDTANADSYPELWFFAGVVKDESLAHKPDDATEKIRWYKLNSCSSPVTHGKLLAGDGDLDYFIRRAVRAMVEGSSGA